MSIEGKGVDSGTEKADEGVSAHEMKYGKVDASGVCEAYDKRPYSEIGLDSGYDGRPFDRIGGDMGLYAVEKERGGALSAIKSVLKQWI